MRKWLRFSLSSLFLVTAIIAAFLGGIMYLQMQQERYSVQRQGGAVILQGDFLITGKYRDSSGHLRPLSYSDVTSIEIHDGYFLIGRGKGTGRYLRRDRIFEFEWLPAPASGSSAAMASVDGPSSTH